MKKYLSLAAGATMLLGTAVGIALPTLANAQAAPATGAASGPFADVPADHWAYTAVNTLQKAGIVIGYPDGTYGGRRAMTRYEFAVAIARLLPQINNIDTSQFVKTGDFQAFQNDVNGRLQQQQAALDALRALVNEFQPELQRLGQDVDAIKQRLDADEQRLAVVEDEQRRLKITGEANFIARGDVNGSTFRNNPLDQNGYRIGTFGNNSIDSNINVYHDILLNFDGRISDTAHAIVKLDAGNYLPTIGSYESLDPFRTESTTAETDQFNIYQAYVDAPVALGPLAGAEAVVGRFGEQFTPYTLKAIDPDVYTNLPETDSGDVTTDGGKLNFGLGHAHVQVYAGKNAPIDDAILTGGPTATARDGAHRPGSNSFGNGGGGQEYFNPIDQSAGARVTFGSPDSYNIGVTALTARVNPTSTEPINGDTYNTISVYGADFQGTIPFVKVSGLTLDGEYAQSATGAGSRIGSVNSNKGTEAYLAELGYTFGAFNVKGGYTQVDNNFAAPGYWGHVGTWTNPANVKGPLVHASYAITSKLSLVGDGYFYQGVYNIANQNPLGREDRLTSYDAGLKYGLTSSNTVDLGYEYVQYNLKNDQGLLTAAGKPTEQYVTIGLGHQLNSNSSLKLLYQIIDYKDKGTGFDPEGNSYGGVAVTQLSVKF